MANKKLNNDSDKSAVKYSVSYASKRPKSAKGVGVCMNTSKYRQSDVQASYISKSSKTKSSINKYPSSFKKSSSSSQLKNSAIKAIVTKSK